MAKKYKYFNIEEEIDDLVRELAAKWVCLFGWQAIIVRKLPYEAHAIIVWDWEPGPFGKPEFYVQDDDIVLGRFFVSEADHNLGAFYLRRGWRRKFRKLAIRIISDAIASELEKN